LEAPVAELAPEKLNLILYGTDGEQIPVHYSGRDGRKATFRTAFEGVIGNLERRYQETQSEYIRGKIQEYMSERPCPSCHGRRLRPEALAVTVDEQNIVGLTGAPVARTLHWIERLQKPRGPLTARQPAIGDRIFKEIHDRLGFLVNLGLDYPTLARP